MKKACSNEKLAENEVEPRLLGCLRTDDLNRLAISCLLYTSGAFFVSRIQSFEEGVYEH